MQYKPPSTSGKVAPNFRDNTVDAGGILRKLISAELYDENRLTFVPTGAISEGRVAQQATLLKNGQVPITGGDGADTPIRTIPYSIR